MSNKEKTPMSEEKKKRIVVAMTAAGVLLVIFLVIILTIQFVIRGNLAAQERKLENMSKELDEKIESVERDLDYFLSWEGLEYLAIKNGWVKSNK